jgi:hypothetical protein
MNKEVLEKMTQLALEARKAGLPFTCSPDLILGLITELKGFYGYHGYSGFEEYAEKWQVKEEES